MFFDKNLNEIRRYLLTSRSLLKLHGLCVEACDVIGDEHLSKKMRRIISVISRTLRQALSDSRLNNEVEHGVVNTWHIWWVQAEGVVGFCNAYQRMLTYKTLKFAGTLELISRIR